MSSNKLKISLKGLVDQEVVEFINERINILSSNENNIYSIDLKYIKDAL